MIGDMSLSYVPSGMIFFTEPLPEPVPFVFWPFRPRSITGEVRQQGVMEVLQILTRRSGRPNALSGSPFIEQAVIRCECSKCSSLGSFKQQKAHIDDKSEELEPTKSRGPVARHAY
jgi:hypothetical protein